jgi:hypothetical protein
MLDGISDGIMGLKQWKEDNCEKTSNEKYKLFQDQSKGVESVYSQKFT